MARKKMSRTTKGVIAALLGLGLLGGFGTFALWSASADVDGGAITAGQFSMTASENPAWTDISPATAIGWGGGEVFGIETPQAKVINIDTFEMVPGDLLEYTTQVTILATGDNMKAELTIDPASVVIPTELQPYVTIQSQVTGPDAATYSAANGSSVLEFDVPKSQTATGDVYDVQVRVGFSGTTPDQVGAGETVDLSNFAIALNQVRPS